MRTIGWAMIVAASLSTSGASAQIKFDGTIGKGGGNVTKSPFFIPVNTAGEVRGSNGFLSFAKFNVRAGEEVNFFPTAPVKNIIARVTGGQTSNINGLISVNLNANFFLINPAGVIFGPSARLDPAGSFVVTTADFLRMADGTQFTASAKSAPTFSSAPPSAFGFLGGRMPAAIRVGDVGGMPTQLTVANGNVLSLIGGPVQLINGKLTAVGGRINLVAIGGVGEVTLDAASKSTTVDTTKLSRGAVVTIEESSVINAGLGGGVTVRGSSFSMDDSVLSTATDVVDGGAIDIAVANAFTLTDSTIDLSTLPTNDKNGNPILSNAGSLHIAAGAVSLSGHKMSGTGVQLAIAAETGHLASEGPTGRGGDVTIDSVGDIDIRNHAAISSSANSTGNGGNIFVRSGHVFTIDGGADGEPFTGLLSETIDPFNGGGNAGQIRVTAPRVNLINQGEIASRTKGPGNSGLIRLNVGQLLIDGSLTKRTDFTGIEARVGDDDGGALGKGGRVLIDADGVTLRRGGVITASTFGRGDAGGVQLNAGSLTIQGFGGHVFTGLFARTTKETAAGNGGGISIEAGRIKVDGPGQISSSSELSSGNAGGVRVHATGPIELSNGGTISAFSDRTNAGKVSIASDSSIYIERATVRGSAGQDGGKIDISADHSLVIRRGSTVSGQAGGNGGSITLTAKAIADAGSTVNGLSNGRKVRVLIAESASLFRSNAVFLGGEIITPPPYDLAGALTPLIAGLQAPAARVMDMCGQRLREGFSSFTVVGNNGMAPTP